MLRWVDRFNGRFFATLVTVSVLIGLSGPAVAQSAVAFVQGNSATPQSSPTSVQVTFTSAQTTGNLNVVVVGWNDTNTQVQSVTDSRGNAYTRAVGPTIRNGLGTQSIYYSTNIASAGAGANTVTVRFSSSAQYPDIRIAEYSGLATSSPVDVVVGAQGAGTTLSDSGTVATAYANDLLVGANLVDEQTVAAGAGFTSRMITVPDGDILEDRVVTAAGNYNATAALTGGAWVMQMVAFRAAAPPDTQTPTPPGSLAATASSSAQVDLTWTPASDNVGVVNYLVERCQGVGCGTFVQIGTTPTSNYSDTSVAASASYSYRVRATDAAANLSAYSNVASASTPAAADTQAPTAPANLAATTSSSAQINLLWTVSTDNVAVTSYLIERCQGIGCTAFAQIGTASTPSYSDTAVSPSTAYRYRVRATDAASNLSGYSNSATATTAAAADNEPPSAPANLVAVPVSSVQVNLGWTASSDNVGVSSYLVERCQGVGCANFVETAAPGTPTYTDGTVVGSTSYTYRVRARDAASNLSDYSNIASVTTPAAPAVISLIQTASRDAGVTTTSSLAFANANAAGNWIGVAIRAGQSGQTFVVTDTRGNTYRQAAQLNETTDGTTLALFYAEDIVGGSNTLTVADSLAGGTLRFAILEYSGVASANSLDVIATAQGTGATASSGSAITTANGELVLGIVSSANGVTFGAGSGYGIQAQVPNPPSSKLFVEDRRQAVSGSISSSATLSAADNWGAILATFRPAGATVDGQSPTAPTNLTATASSSGQVNLSWTASTDDVGVIGYLVERCQGLGCSSFAQIGSTTGLAYNDATVGPVTSYSYRVRASDVATNLSDYSNTATAFTPAPPDTQAPTAPTSLTAVATGGTQVNLSWTASTDNVAVTSYLVERCQGAGCSTFVQIGSTGVLAYNDATVSPSTIYSYRIRASDAAMNFSGYSSTALVTTLAPPAAVSLVQAVGRDAGTTLSSTLAFASNNTAGNWIAVAIRAGQAGQTFVVSDSRGNTYRRAAQLNEAKDGTSLALFYAENIAAGANTVTVSDSLAGGTLRFAILEYTGVATANSLDATATAQGTSTLASSATVTTTVSGELVLGIVSSANGLTFGAGSGYVVEALVPDPPNTKLFVEDQRQISAGPIAASATLSGSDDWGVLVATFRPAGPPDTQAPTAPGTLTATAMSPTQVNLAWTTSADNVGVTSYLIERCQGIGCASFSQVATSAGTSYTDGSVVASTNYTYRVRATDAASNLSGYSNTASATTPAPADTQPPTAPSNLTATPVSSTQVNLSWAAATDNVAVTNYLVERCQGAGCNAFAQIGTTNAASYSDATATASTSYSYRVRATDAASNLGGYSNTASATTSTPADTQPPSAPGTVTATVVSGTQVDLSWVAATDNVGVTGYRVERCQGVGCSVYVKLATPTTTTFSDIGLTPNTSYSYVVLATDSAGNLGPYSNPVSLTTGSNIPELVAAYSFDEGTGTMAFDASGRANDGAIGTATWTPDGRFGGALSFDGATSRVVVQDNSSLRLTNGLTLEAWVKPRVVTTGWRDVIYKGDDNYFLEATTSSSARPGAGLTLALSGNAVTFGPTALSANVWTHLAETYDGVTVRLFVNGVQVASTAQTGLVVTSPYPLEIGGDSLYGQSFDGLIDEVRVFNVARTPTQIQSDMVTPLGVETAAANLSPSSLDFGQQVIGIASSIRTVTLSNPGDLTLNISSIAIGGAQASEYSQTNDCAATLDPAGSCTVSITLTPAGSGSRTAQVIVQDDAPGAPHTVLLQGTGVAVLLTPSVATLTPGRSQQFSAIGGATGVFIWSVDGIENGSTATGLVDATGLYTAPALAGNHTITATTSDGLLSGTATVHIVSYSGTLTARNDNARTGANLSETVLIPSTVTASKFGKLTSFDIDGEAYASPLYVPAVTIPGGGVRNVVYVATEHDSVYAFDADGSSSAPLWRVSFINPTAGITTVSPSDVGECCDISPEIGISGTPVIDATRGVLYVVAKTKEVVGQTTTFVQRLHALDLATGQERLGGPVVIQASVPGTGAGTSGGRIVFSSLRQNQRPALLLQNGIVYIAFGSHGDQQPYHGWLLGYDAATLQQRAAYNTTPDGEGAGVWIASSGPATDSDGNIYFVTGDGTFDANTGGTGFGDSYLKMDGGGAIRDYFTPHDQGVLDSNNIDLGSGGAVVLPDQPGAHPHLLVSAGKNGTIDLIDRDNMGHYRPNDDSQIVQSLVNIFPFGTPEPGNYSAPVYFNGSLYFSPVSDNVQAFTLTNGLLPSTPTSRSSEIFAYPGGTLSLSATGNTNGILWAIERRENGAGALRAYDATNLATELYNSDQAGTRDTLDQATKFSAPLVANGRVYVASKTRVTIFGLLPQ